MALTTLKTATFAPQRAQAEANVLIRDLQRRQTTRVAMLFHGACHTAEAKHRLPSCLFRSQAPAKILLDRGLDVRGDLCVQVRIERSAAKHGEDAVP